MNIQNGKFYDAVKMREFCDGWKDLVVNYIDKKETTDGHFSTFNDTESFRGMTADQSKLFVKKGMGRMLRKVAKTQIKMRKAQAEVMELFENMVDPSQNARIEYDTLELINNDFKELYYIYKDRADNVRRIVDCLNNEFGNYAYFEQPDSQTGLDAFYDFCGGDSDTAGYIRNCQNKLAAFDATAKALLTGKDTMDNTKKINTHVVYTKEALAPAPAENIKTVKVTLDPVDNSKATANAKKNTKDDMYKYIQSYYGFTDDEMTYLKENYPGLLSSLYGTTKYSSSDADKVYQMTKDKLKSMTFHAEASEYGGRKVIIGKSAPGKDWYNEEGLDTINNNAINILGSNNEVVNKNGVLIDKEGRYWVAVGPNVINPNHNPEEKITPEEMKYGTKIDVKLIDKDGNVKYLYCIVGEAKQHTYPDGIHQTGRSIPGGEENVGSCNDGSVIEFCGRIPVSGLSNYHVEEIIVHE